jgi:hypothetical protein
MELVELGNGRYLTFWRDRRERRLAPVVSTVAPYLSRTVCAGGGHNGSPGAIVAWGRLLAAEMAL